MNMEPFDNDPISDEEIRKILQEPLSGSEPWAEPGERVWAGIEAALPVKRKRRFGGWWWLPLFGLLVLMSTVYMGSDQTDTHDMDQTAANQPFNQTKNQHNISSIEKEEAEKTTLNIPEHNDNSLIATLSQDTPSEKVIPSTKNSANANSKQRHNGNHTRTTLPKPSSELNRSESFLPHPSLTNQTDHFLLPSTLDLENQPLIKIEYPEAGHNDQIEVGSTLPTFAVPAFLPLRQVAPERKVVILQFPAKEEPRAFVPAPTPTAHRLLAYAHGTEAGRDVRTSGMKPNLDPETNRSRSNIRFGLGYEYQARSGLFFGTGVEYQEFSEVAVKEKEWLFTKIGAIPSGPNQFNQQFNVLFVGGLGTTSADLRVSIGQQQNTVDYQEGDPVHLKLTVEQNLRQMRIPIYAGYRFEKKYWFAEVRGGVGLNVQVSYDAQLTGLLETRNRIKLLAPPSLRKPANLESTYWDLQGGIYAGYKLSGNTEIGIGYEMWQSLQPVVDNPKFKTYLNGSGFNAGVRLAF